MTEPPSVAGRRAASRYLGELLLRPGRYRRLWEKFAERTRPGEINQLAVAEALAQYLWDFPRSASDADVLPLQLKDTVGRALSGRLLSRSTLASRRSARCRFVRPRCAPAWSHRRVRGHRR